MNDCRTRKSLTEIALPKGYRLLQPTLRQRAHKGLVVRTFTLVYEGNKRLGPVEHEEVYEFSMSDALQLAWALRKLEQRVQILETARVAALPTRVEAASANFGAAVAKAAAQMGLPA